MISVTLKSSEFTQPLNEHYSSCDVIHYLIMCEPEVSYWLPITQELLDHILLNLILHWLLVNTVHTPKYKKRWQLLPISLESLKNLLCYRWANSNHETPGPQ